MTAPTLRPYQRAGLDAIVGAIDADLRRVLIKKPTGTGKTVMFAAMLEWPGLKEWIASFGKRRGARLLVIAHREELLDQALEKIQRANPQLMCSIEQGDRHANRYSDVVIASIQTLAAMKFRRLERFMAHHDPSIVVVDEAHHAAAATYRTVLARLGFLPSVMSSETGEVEAATHDDVAKMTEALEGWDKRAPRDRLLVGVTATPNRTDAIGLGCVFQSIAYSYGLKEAIDDGWLVPIRPWVIETASSLDQVRTSHGDFNQKDLAEAVNDPRRNRLALDAWTQYAGDRQTIAFTVDVAHAYAVAELMSAAGIRAAAISGETPKDTRRQILRDYTAGRIQVLSNCMVLTEGTDLPATSCILHLKPTQSPTLYEQMTGRGLRLAEGKSDCVVIDLVDISRRHSLQAAPVLYGLPPGIKTKGEDLKKTAEDLEALREKYAAFDVDAALASGRFSIAELLDRASTFDVWAIPSLGDVANVVTLDWMKIGEDTYRISYPWADGHEVLLVSPNVLGQFDVSATLRPASLGTSPFQRTPIAAGHHAPGGAPGVRQRTIAAGVTNVVEALRFAEAFVDAERQSAKRLTDRSAGWRQRPATEKQIQLLQRLRVPFNPKDLAKPGGAGRASQLIDLAKSRKVGSVRR
jgi:superfamily II DNA or RNA helicase